MPSKNSLFASSIKIIENYHYPTLKCDLYFFEEFIYSICFHFSWKSIKSRNPQILNTPRRYIFSSNYKKQSTTTYIVKLNVFKNWKLANICTKVASTLGWPERAKSDGRERPCGQIESRPFGAMKKSRELAPLCSRFFFLSTVYTVYGTRRNEISNASPLARSPSAPSCGMKGLRVSIASLSRQAAQQSSVSLRAKMVEAFFGLGCVLAACASGQEARDMHSLRVRFNQDI